MTAATGPSTRPRTSSPRPSAARSSPPRRVPSFATSRPSKSSPSWPTAACTSASESSFYRVLHEQDLQQHRGRARAPAARPRGHVANGPWQLASWDITYLRSHIRGEFFYLYLVEDVWSRKILGWDVHDVESADFAADLIERIRKDNPGVDLRGWVLHSDNGGPMKGATMLATMHKLGIVPSFSRPRVSDDNAYAESLFRTLKYCPEYPSKGFRHRRRRSCVGRSLRRLVQRRPPAQQHRLRHAVVPPRRRGRRYP